MTTTGSVIYGADYNAVVVKIQQVLGTGTPYGPGTGSPQYGYNQTVASSTVAPAAIITAAQWTNLQTDINKCYLHQNNSSYAFSSITSGLQINGTTLDTINTVMSGCVTNATTAATGQLTQTTAITNTYATTWGGGNSGIRTTASTTFASQNVLQYFFNQGGKFRFQGYGPTLSGSTQDANWSTALAAFSYTIDLVEFAALTTTPAQRFYSAAQPTPYTANYIQVSASHNGAGVLNFTITYEDSHTGTGVGPDVVSAGAGFYLYQNATTGAFTGYTPSSTSGAVAWTVV